MTVVLKKRCLYPHLYRNDRPHTALSMKIVRISNYFSLLHFLSAFHIWDAGYVTCYL